MSGQNGQDLLNGVSQRSRPVLVDYDSHFSAEANRWHQMALQKNFGYMLLDGYLKLAGGLPNPGMFPVTEAHFTLKDGSVIHVDQDTMKKSLQYGQNEGYASELAAITEELRTKARPSDARVMEIGEDEAERAFRRHSLPFLREWLIEFQTKVHSPPIRDPKHPGHFDLIVTSGSNCAIALTFRMLLDEGDFVLVEEPTFTSALSMIEHPGCALYAVKGDKDGMIAEELERVLTSWSDLQPGARKPRVLYIVTSAGNPTGVNWSLNRKRAVYDLARAHDLLIMEDDAYFFLQFNRPLVPSLLSMDTDGRVVRFDSFSKVIAPGPRFAMMSGPATLLQKLRDGGDVGYTVASGVSQAMLSQLLRHWGHDGFLRHMDSVMEFYKQKAAKAVLFAKRYLAAEGLADWYNPDGGMFLWLRVLGVKDSEVIVDKALERQLLLVAGVHFMPANQESPYIRINYATCSDEELEEAFKILAEVIKNVRPNAA